MAHTNPNQPPFDGATWTGFEWVTPERYEQLVAAGTIARPASAPQAPAIPEPEVPYDSSHGADVVRDLLRLVGEDPNRGGLLETPSRVVKAWRDWTSGYSVDIKSLLKVFEDGAQGCDEMVVVKDIPIYSHCEHHLAAIFGTATIGYLPDGKIVGLSKLNRLADAYARRLQVQERMTNQIAEALMEHLAPLGCGVVIKARHMCMESRGVCQQGTVTFTSALRGVFREDPSVRAEFLALARE